MRRMNGRTTPHLYGLGRDQIRQLIQIARDESGDGLTRAHFEERVLALFEDIAGFDTLPQKRCQRLLSILWQSYESARRPPK